jgi:hypothetical protein
LEYPSIFLSKSLRMHSDSEMYMFKYGLLNGMEGGHLIDSYLTKLVETPAKISPTSLQLNAEIRWTRAEKNKLEMLRAQAERTTVPICKDCNSTMTKPKSEAVVVFYSVLKSKWFATGVIPFRMLKGGELQKSSSDAKKIEALVTFFTFLPPRPESDDGSVVAVEDDVAGRAAALKKTAARKEKVSLAQMLGEKGARFDEKRIKKIKKMVFDMDGETWKIVDIAKGKKTWEFQIESVDSDGGVPLKKMFKLKELREALKKENDESRSVDISDDEDEDSEIGKESEEDKNDDIVFDEILEASTENDSDSDGSGGEAGPPNILVVKDSSDMWTQMCLVKIVSHLMQWGATQNSRHKAVAIFWAALYMWHAFLADSQRGEMPFEMWFVHVFRIYYSHVFGRNTWFSHEAVTLRQVTNAYYGMARSSRRNKENVGWMDWVQKQMALFRDTICGINDYVFLSEKNRLSPSSLEKVLKEKKQIVDMTMKIREEVTDSETFFRLLYNIKAMDSLHDIFAWYLFIMNGELHVNEYVWKFKLDLRKVFSK